MNLTKTCTACHENFPFENFNKQAGTRDGLQYECKRCMARRSMQRYVSNPDILEKNKQWQSENKDKHNEAAKRYYHSPTGRLNRGLNKSLDNLFSKSRPSLNEIIGTSVSCLLVHLLSSLPEGVTLEDYQQKWVVGFVEEPKNPHIIAKEEIPKLFNWKNLCVKEKELVSEDFGVSSF